MRVAFFALMLVFVSFFSTIANAQSSRGLTQEIMLQYAADPIFAARELADGADRASRFDWHSCLIQCLLMSAVHEALGGTDKVPYEDRVYAFQWAKRQLHTWSKNPDLLRVTLSVVRSQLVSTYVRFEPKLGEHFERVLSRPFDVTIAGVAAGLLQCRDWKGEPRTKLIEDCKVSEAVLSRYYDYGDIGTAPYNVIYIVAWLGRRYDEGGQQAVDMYVSEARVVVQAAKQLTGRADR